ncbi:PilC/PilY family type IV pilus protein [Ramlibacter sp. AN1133]|uniref:PilC/PilY family type IV pilus protein n=1 Tax=Ramlibacter sp. AN1133 TaxID=3133429 RepID=UPI0030C57E73
MKAADLKFTSRLRSFASAAAWLLAACSAAAIAANTDIAGAPLFTSSSGQIKPNIMFILDDSGSMGRDYVPDEAGFSHSVYGYRAAQCNGVAYDPTVTYNPPVSSTGVVQAVGTTAFLDPTSTENGLTSIRSLNNITAAQWPTGPNVNVNVTVTGSFSSGSYAADGSQEVTVYGSASKFFIGVVTAWNGSTGAMTIRVWDVVGTGALSPASIGKGVANTYFTYSSTSPQRKLGYSYDATANLITSSTFYRECSSAIGSTPGSNVFVPHAVGSTSAEAQNYANWNRYYRTRMDMMKTAMTWAFKGIDDRYRVGFTTISSTNATEGTSFLNIRDFDATQKASFYTKLNAADPSITTPLRGALAKAGRYFANKAPGQTVDPVQYSCQRNFTLLSTDGYWNTGFETSTYGALQLDGTTKVGQQDGGGTLRPMFDGGSVTRTTTETWTVTTVTVSTKTQPSVTTSTLTTSTTTMTPRSTTAGQQQTAFVLVPSFTVDGSKMTRTGGNLVTVTVAAGHNLVTGDNIEISASNNGTFNNSFRDTNGVTVTVLSPTQFTYASSGTNGTASGTYTVRPGGVSCSGSQAVQRSLTQVRDSVNVTTTFATDTTTQNSTSTFTTTKTDVTQFSRVIKTVNGTQVNDTGPVAGTLNSRSVDGTPTVTNGTAVTTHQVNTPAPTTTTDFSPWVTTAAGNVGTSCRSSPSSSSAITQNLPSTTTSTFVVNPPTTAGPTTVLGTAIVVVNSTDTTESPVPHASVSAVTSSTGGTSNTLADVAMYYYQTDLRDAGLGNCTGSLGADVCNNNVPGSKNDAAHSYGDSANWQHMTTFTLGLGASGLLRYDPNYLTQLSGDYFDITNTSKNWPSPVETVSGGEPQNIDDLWHAAVNGRGQYFSAGDPTTLTNSLNSALDSIKAITGSASAASTSSLQPVQGDNDIYVAQFTTQKWVGDVLSRRIDPTTGQISSTVTWSAKAQLDTRTADSRTIYYPNPSGTSVLRTFTFGNLSTDGYDMSNFCSRTGASGSGNPQQCAQLSAADTTAANDGRNLVNYLRGDQTLSYYRTRDNLLGDIINASPLFVGKPGFRYNENDYQAFVAAQASRQAVVLAAANDGMLHAFDRATGNELWAYVPSFVIRNMYKLADTNYANNHSYFVDGSPQMGDIFVGGAWKTIVVGGLSAGGRGYYALDVTNPAAPKLLWEFGTAQNANLGLTFGNPIITKRANGTWVVVFASGYNNVSPGDGNGHLIVVDANTGAQLVDLQTYSSGTTPAGSSSTPSGLAKINDWVDTETTNSARRFYGGDMLGNLWRFDIDSLVEPNNAALLLARLTGPTGAVQPVSTVPTVAEVNYNGSRFPVVFVATGRYLGTSDLTDSRVQSIYAIKDPLTNSSYGVVRSNTNFATQTITVSGTDRTSSANSVDWMTKAGWRVDLPAGERVSVDPQLALQTLFIGSNLPNSDSCSAGGKSFLYKFNIATGSSTSNYVGDVMIQGVTVVQLTSGAVEGIVTESTGDLTTFPGDPESAAANLRRTSWRELLD